MKMISTKNFNHLVTVAGRDLFGAIKSISHTRGFIDVQYSKHNAQIIIETNSRGERYGHIFRVIDGDERATTYRIIN